MTLPSTPASSSSMSVLASRLSRGWLSVSSASTTCESARAVASRTLESVSGPAMACLASRSSLGVAGSRASRSSSVEAGR